jgi:hypothetical protein
MFSGVCHGLTATSASVCLSGTSEQLVPLHTKIHLRPRRSVGRFTILLDESIGIQNPFGVRNPYLVVARFRRHVFDREGFRLHERRGY